MKLARYLAVLLMLAPADAFANGSVPTVKTDDQSYALQTPVDCQITVTTTATSLSSLMSAASCASIPSWAQAAQLTPESYAAGAVIRYRTDGTSATTTGPIPILGWQTRAILSNAGISAASLISATGSNVVVDVEIQC